MDLIDREWVLNNPEKPCTFVDAVMCAPTVEAIPVNVIEEIKTEIENSSCGSWYVENPDKTLEKVVLLRMVDVLDIIDKKVKEHTK